MIATKQYVNVMAGALLTIFGTAYAAAESPASTTPGAPETYDSENSVRDVLLTLEGDYDLTSTFWFAPQAEPEVTRLHAQRSLAVEGRVLKIDVGPNSGGFRGTGLLGYDHFKESFWYIWADTANTGVAFLHGSLRGDGSGVFSGRTPTPVGYSPLRVEIRRDGATEVHGYFGPGESGDEYRWLELRYEPVSAR